MRTPLAFAMLTAAGLASGQVIYVDSAAAPGGDGSAWGRAFDSLHDALAAASPGEQVWVRQGSYVPKIPMGREATFAIPAGVQVYGGFAGGETSLSQRDPDDNTTELSGDGVSYTVVTIAGDGATLDGFTVSKGLADGTGNPANSRGAGVYSSGNFGILRNNHFVNNVSNADGAAVTVRDAPLSQTFVIEDCVFVGNDGDWVISLEAAARIEGCNLRDNTGGALLLQGEAVYTVVDNGFSRHDGATTVNVLTDPGSFTLFDECLFIDNTGLVGGAIRFAGSGFHEVRSCIFRGNEATISIAGGAITLDLPSASDQLLVDNSLLIGNSTAQGGGINKQGVGRLDVVNSTIVGNTVSSNIGAGISTVGGVTAINNSIVFGNINAGGLFNDERVSVFTGTGVTSLADRSIIQFLGQGLSPIVATNSTNADPMLVDPDGNDNTFGTSDDNPRPAPGSPAIDAGDNDYLGFANADAFGQTRLRDDTGTPDTGNSSGIGVVVDIGALEFQGTTPNDCPADTNGDGLLSPADFNGWILAFNTQSPACDQNGDGLCTPADFNAWLLNYNTGC